MLVLWPVEKLAELADILTGCGEMASDVCLFAWNFNMRRSTVITEAEYRNRPNMTLLLY
jgi:hypothetical protein